MKTDEYKKNVMDYLNRNMDKGYDMDTLKWALIKQGYSRSIVEWAMEQVHQKLAEKAPLLEEKQEVMPYEMTEENMPSEPKKSFWKRLFGGK